MQLALLGKQVVDQFLLDLQQLFGAATKGGAMANLIVAGVQIAQHQLNGIQGGAVGERGCLGLHSGQQACCDGFNLTQLSQSRHLSKEHSVFWGF